MTGQKHKMPCHIKKERKFYIETTAKAVFFIANEKRDVDEGVGVTV